MEAVMTLWIKMVYRTSLFILYKNEAVSNYTKYNNY